MNIEDKFAVLAFILALVSPVLLMTAELIDVKHVVTKRCLFIATIIVSTLGLLFWFLSGWQWGF